LTVEGNGQSEMAEGLKKLAPQRSVSPFRVIEPEGLPLRERSDEDLMLLHGEGSEEAFEELVRRHQKGVLNYMYRMVQNRHVAEELTQEAFMALVKNAKRYEPTAKFTTYLYAISSNIVSKEWLRAKRRPKLFSLSSFWNAKSNDEDEFNPLEHLSDSHADVGEGLERVEVSEAVNGALQELPDHQREAFVLLRFRNMSYQEISEVTDTPVGTVKSRVVRAERALRPLLSKFREYL
jgi:RNA polymerase sigma-70 factor (ECF subfamily)